MAIVLDGIGAECLSSEGRCGVAFRLLFVAISALTFGTGLQSLLNSYQISLLSSNVR